MRMLRRRNKVFYTTSHPYQSPSRFDDVTWLAWSPTENRLVASYEGGTVRIWDTATDQLALIYRGHSVPVYTVVWSPDGTRLAGNTQEKDGKYRVVVWDTMNGQPLFTHHYWSSAGHFSYSLNGTHLAIGHSNGKVRIVEEVHRSLHPFQSFWLHVRG